ncbi:MAG: dTDP-4-dehydrorhamnose 3,5-epimerase [Phycisphaerales bacterium]|nr:dTDP-4-dehydrorhamnose 3,5-epimerase [Phycisphaerales bacterium]
MRFEETPIAGVTVVTLELRRDERGGFARTWCQEEFRTHGLEPRIAQCSVSLNHRRGTLRGMHYQTPPHEECKLVRVTRGAAYDVALDVRRGSPTYGRWFALELAPDHHRMLYLPRGVAHGFQTLLDDTEIAYQMSTPYHPDHAAGVRWNDPHVGIPWPLKPTVMSKADQTLPMLHEVVASG